MDAPSDDATLAQSSHDSFLAKGGHGIDGCRPVGRGEASQEGDGCEQHDTSSIYNLYLIIWKWRGFFGGGGA